MIDGVHDRRFLEAGKVVFNKGDNAYAFYFIDSGNIEMWDHVGSEKKKILTLGKGDIFGEMALLDASPRMYTAIVGAEGATLVCVQISYVEKILKESHPFVKILLKRLMENMRRLQK